MTHPEIISIGEALIDFIAEQPGSLLSTETFTKSPGGAPANVAVGLARLGVKVGFIGKVGDDPFGKFLVNKLEKEKVLTQGAIRSSKRELTSLAFVSLNEEGERDFFFYRANAADLKLQPDEIDPHFFSQIKFLCFGSLSLSTEPSRSAIFKAIKECKKNGGKVCFDPNIRLDIWEDKSNFIKIVKEALKHTEIFLPSQEELYYLNFSLTSQPNRIDEQIIEHFCENFPLETLVIKKGKAGCSIKTKKKLEHIPGFKVKVIDTTGAGDGFNAGFLFGLLLEKTLEEAALLGNAVGALVVQKKGAMTALPTKEELKIFLKNHKIDIEI
ncbi:MAG: histidine kinase [Candidatus Heimdallarchaeota archaeon]|nr:histidine kinase [Candidatus Heimdallarchaeota archaeon]